MEVIGTRMFMSVFQSTLTRSSRPMSLRQASRTQWVKTPSTISSSGTTQIGSIAIRHRCFLRKGA